MPMVTSHPKSIAENLANRYRGSSAYGRVLEGTGPIGRDESPVEMERRAALLAAKEKAKAQGHPSLSGASQAQGLAMQALQRRAEDTYAYGQAQQGLEREFMDEVDRGKAGQGLAGFQAPQKYAPEDLSRISQAMVMSGNQARGGSFAPRGFAGEERPDDPRMTTQGRNQFGRIAEDAQAQQAARVAQAQQQAADDAKRLAERRRITTEGDAWVAGRQANSQALHALGTRNARAY